MLFPPRTLLIPNIMTISLLVLDIFTFIFENWYHYLIRNYRRTSEAICLKLCQNVPDALQFKNLILFLISPDKFLVNQQKSAGVDVFLTLRFHNLKTLKNRDSKIRSN